ncbi:MAG TPA: DUF4136 domain-containing protein [Burkholderiaceae bacterium]|nr:DUF4136 domain-containing protein [Burkholderiaceae bacterium]
MISNGAVGPGAFWRFGVVAALLALGGCASTLSARVTTYQQWPVGTQGEYYRIVAEPQQAGNLEFGAFSDMLRASIGPTGLREATGDARARFDVRMQYGTELKQTWVQRYDDAYLNDGWMGPAFGGYYGGWGGWGGGIFYRSAVVTVPVDVYHNTLTVTITDQSQQGREVYRATAVHRSDADNLAAVMPYLMQAIFDDFPGNNGQVREVRYDLPR